MAASQIATVVQTIASAARGEDGLGSFSFFHPVSVCRDALVGPRRSIFSGRAIKSESKVMAKRDHALLRRRSHVERAHVLDLEHAQDLSGTGRADRRRKYALLGERGAVLISQYAEHGTVANDAVVQGLSGGKSRVLRKAAVRSDPDSRDQRTLGHFEQRQTVGAKSNGCAGRQGTRKMRASKLAPMEAGQRLDQLAGAIRGLVASANSRRRTRSWASATCAARSSRWRSSSPSWA